MKFFMKGIDIHNPNLTRRPRIWWAYLCWCIQFQMECHKPYYPMFIRMWAHNHYGEHRFGMTWEIARNWERIDPNYKLTKEWTPLPWYMGNHALGCLIIPWNRVARWFRSQTLDLSHRCEFTDLKHGALYTGLAENFMDVYFEEFIERISPDSVKGEE